MFAYLRYLQLDKTHRAIFVKYELHGYLQNPVKITQLSFHCIVIDRNIGVIGKKLTASGSPEVLPCGVILGGVSGLS